MGRVMKGNKRQSNMKTMTVRKVTAVTRLLAGMALTAPALAEESTEELAKQTQNPVADLISVPFLFPK